MHAINWPLFEQHASLPAIDHYLDQAEREVKALTRTVYRLTELRKTRYNQMAAGEWPPKPEGTANAPQPSVDATDGRDTGSAKAEPAAAATAGGNCCANCEDVPGYCASASGCLGAVFDEPWRPL